MKKPKIILGIETSCDETSAAICQNTQNGVKILSNIVASSAPLQAKYGGVIPEQAAREQLSSIIPVLKEAFEQANLTKEDIDALAVTQGPGLIGSLLVGVETAKILATIWKKPLIPINHLIGHFYANWIRDVSSDKYQVSSLKKHEACSVTLVTPIFPAIGLLISGGHTDLILMKDHGKFTYLGGTRDDAAGECFDKCARLLGLPYPGGPAISKIAEKGNPKAYKLPRPMIDSKDFDFSFSGLKTAVHNIVRAGDTEESSQASTASLSKTNEDAPETPKWQDPQAIANLSASIQESIADVLAKKTVLAAKTYCVDQIIVAGGVAANQKIAKKIVTEAQSQIARVRIFIPPPSLCTDNAAMISSAAFFNFNPVDPLTLQANPNLSLS
ncbi:MAG: tRNA (adenosine(37)-N6)-threonylcarbamoyltransferase complex transferase subunit TsaD [Candidatus Daviesbacteria bacterium]